MRARMPAISLPARACRHARSLSRLPPTPHPRARPNPSPRPRTLETARTSPPSAARASLPSEPTDRPDPIGTDEPEPLAPHTRNCTNEFLARRERARRPPRRRVYRTSPPADPARSARTNPSPAGRRLATPCARAGTTARSRTSEPDLPGIRVRPVHVRTRRHRFDEHRTDPPTEPARVLRGLRGAARSNPAPAAHRLPTPCALAHMRTRSRTFEPDIPRSRARPAHVRTRAHRSGGHQTAPPTEPARGPRAVRGTFEPEPRRPASPPAAVP